MPLIHRDFFARSVHAVAPDLIGASFLLDGVGGFMTYGVIENAPGFAERNLLPMGMVEGCRLLRDVAKDDSIAYSDVELPKGRLCDQLRTEQADQFVSDSPASFRTAVQI